MWFLAQKEIVHNKTRFALFAGLVALLSFLVFVMTGLSTGLGEASVSGLRTLTEDAQIVVFAPSVDRSLGRSDVDVGDDAAIASVDGVDAVAPIGQSMVNIATPTGSTIAVALVGVPDSTAVFPSTQPMPPGTIVVDATAADGLEVGDTVAVQPGGRSLTVGGFSDLGSLQHTPVAYTPLATWQQVRYAAFDATQTGVPDRASAFLVTTTAGAATDETIASISAQTGLDAATPADAVAASPGYKEETGTINLIRGFLFGIAARLVGTVFWILTLQKEGPLAVLRAAGARPRMLIGSYLVQVIATTAAGIGVGLIAAEAAALVMPSSAYVLAGSDALTASALLAILALIASAASMRRLFTIDPLLSLGRL